MSLDLLRMNNLMGIIVPEVMMVLMLRKFFRRNRIIFRFPVLVLLNGFQNIVLLYRNTFNLLDSQPFAEGDNACTDGNKAAQGDPHTGTPCGSIDATPVPHPSAKKDLEDRVKHVEVDDRIKRPCS